MSIDSHNPYRFASKKILEDLDKFSLIYLDEYCVDTNDGDEDVWWHVDFIYMGNWKYDTGHQIFDSGLHEHHPRAFHRDPRAFHHGLNRGSNNAHKAYIRYSSVDECDLVIYATDFVKGFSE